MDLYLIFPYDYLKKNKLKWIRIIVFIFLFSLINSCDSEKRLFCKCGSKDIKVINNTASKISVSITTNFINYEFLRSIEPFEVVIVKARTNFYHWQTSCPPFNEAYLVAGDSTFENYFYIDPSLKDDSFVMEVEN